MLYPSPAQDRQPSGPTPLLRELQQYCPGYFSGSEFGMFGHRRAPLEGSIGVRVTHGIAGYAGNGTTNCAVVPWQGINLNTRPEMTWVLVYKKNATGILNGNIAGFGATGGSSGNTLFRITGEATANSVRLQVQDSSGTTYSNTVSSDFGADDQRYHCVVVSGAARSLDDGGGFQYYADGKKLNFSPSQVQSGNPASTLFNIATLLCARRGGAISGADGNYDVALFVPLFGIRQPDWWCEEVSRNPWQLFESEQRIWMPGFVAAGGPQTESGGGASAIDVLSAGAGTALEAASGGAASLVAVLAAGAGAAAEAAAGGAVALIEVASAGAGDAIESAQGGAAAAVDVVVAGAGQALEHAQGGAVSLVDVISTGAGVEGAVTAGGSTALVAVLASGAGLAVERASGGAGAGVMVTPSGAGLALEIAVGGGAALTQVSATGGGYVGDLPVGICPSAEEIAAAVRAGLTAEITAAVRVELSAELERIVRLHKVHGLEAGAPLVVTPTSRVAGDVAQTITTAGETVTVQSA